MTILRAGTFRVSDFRKAISASAEREVRKRYQMDHRPPLAERDYDTDAGDFVPPQNDARFLFLIEKEVHAERTFGRKAGAERTVSTRGSDIGDLAHGRRLRDNERVRQAAIAHRRGENDGAAELLAQVEQPRRKFKRRIPSRINPWPKGRKFPSRKDRRQQRAVRENEERRP